MSNAALEGVIKTHKGPAVPAPALARMVGVSRQRIHAMIHRKRLGSISVGPYTFIPVDEAERLIASRRTFEREDREVIIFDGF